MLRLIAWHEMSNEELAKVAGVSRKSMFNYRDKVVKAGVAGLLTHNCAGGPMLLVRERWPRSLRS